MGFESLWEIVEIQTLYTLRSSLAIHAGETGLLQMSNNPVVRIGGVPTLPGSSLKGALRSNVEAIMAQGRANFVCVPSTAIPQSVGQQKEERSKYLQKIGRLEPCLADKPCPACQIFGTAGGKTGLSGIAIVLDAKLQGDTTHPEQWTMERSHTAITRDSRSQSGGALVTLEALDAGAQFLGTVRLINPKDWQVGAVLRGLETISILGLGAKKTAGYGEVDVEIKKIHKKTLKDGNWEDRDEEAKRYVDAFSKWLSERKSNRP